MRHLQLLKENSDFDNLLSKGDNMPRPLVSYIEDGDTLKFKKPIKRIAKFDVKETDHPRLDEDLTLIKNMTCVKSLKVNGQEINFTPYYKEEMTLSYNDVLSYMSFDDENIYSSITINDEVFLVPNPTQVDNALALISTNDKWILGNDADINDYCFLILMSDGNQTQSEFSPLNSILGLEGSMLEKEGNTISISDGFNELMQQLPSSANISMICYNAKNPELTDVLWLHLAGIGDKTYSVSEYGTYELELEFNTSDIPFDLFNDNIVVRSESGYDPNVYKYCYLTELNDDFFEDLTSLPSFIYSVGLTKIVIPESVKQIHYAGFTHCEHLTTIVCKAPICPTVLLRNGDEPYRDGFDNMPDHGGTLYYPKGSDYSELIELLPYWWDKIEVEF